jgi:hypothetical protein
MRCRFLLDMDGSTYDTYESSNKEEIQRYPFLGFVSECQVVLIEPINHVKEGAIISCISLFNSLLKISVLDTVEVLPKLSSLGTHVNRLVSFRLSRLE